MYPTFGVVRGGGQPGVHQGVELEGPGHDAVLPPLVEDVGGV